MPRVVTPAELSIFAALFNSVAEEMGTALWRSSLSPNIKERRDYSCGLFDPQGRMVAMAPHIPLHLGAMPPAVRSVLVLAPFRPGDLIILNDPYLSGTHLPDITMVSPVFVEGDRGPTLAFFAASRAHQADVGGTAPGSMSLARELIQEGIVIPPVRLEVAGELQRDVLEMILRNVRTPEERRGDLRAQAAAHRVGARRMGELVQRYSLETCWVRMADLMDYTERMTRLAIARIPDGAYAFEDALDDDGFGSGPIPLRVRVTVVGDSMTVDFTGSSPSVEGSVNATAAVTASAVHYVVRCLLPREVPANEGSNRPLRLIFPERSVVNAARPHAVAGSVETAQRVVDVMLGALSRALPEVIPAASCGSMNNVTLGGWDSGRGCPFAYYETVAGGCGGTPRGPGPDALHTHMTNTLNTPVEALEMTYPLRIREYAVRRRGEGSGRHPGGAGVRRVWETLVPATCGLMSDRRVTRPWGLRGGGQGAVGRNWLLRRGRRRRLPSKALLQLEPGDLLVMETPGGGGWGEPPRVPRAAPASRAIRGLRQRRERET